MVAANKTTDAKNKEPTKAETITGTSEHIIFTRLG